MPEVRTLRTWNGATPSNIRQRMMYEVAARNVPSFSKAWLKATRDLSDGANLSAIEEAVQNLDAQAVINAIPSLSDLESLQFQKMQIEFERAYTKTIDQTFEVERKRQGWVFKSFTLENPFSLAWIADRSKALVEIYIIESQREVIRQILLRSLRAESAQPPRAVAREILDRVDLGLTARDEGVVDRFLSGLLEKGVNPRDAQRQADKLAEKKRKQRALTIARTETIDAEARGVLDTWRVAQGDGLVPPTAQKEWIAAEFVSSRPPCQICQGLDETVVPLGEDFTFAVGSSTVSKPSPTAHPRCRCTIELVLPDEEVEGPFSASDFG